MPPLKPIVSQPAVSQPAPNPETPYSIDCNAGCDITKTPERLHITANAQTKNLRELRCAVESFASEIGFASKAAGDIGLAVNEAVANVIRHAYHFDQKMPIDLNVLKTPNGVTIEIRDWGNGALPPNAAAVRSTDMIPEPGGLGLICMKTLMNEITFEQQQPGVLLRMSRQFDSR